MKRIILSDEDKIKYELRIKEIAIKRNKRRFGEKYKTHPEWSLRVAKMKRRRNRQLQRQENLKKKKVDLVDFYKTKEWRTLRFVVLRKFGFKCLGCGRGPDKCVLHVDHIKPRIAYPELELDLNNLQVLCEDCNLGKGWKFQDDLRITQPNGLLDQERDF